MLKKCGIPFSNALKCFGLPFYCFLDVVVKISLKKPKRLHKKGLKNAESPFLMHWNVSDCLSTVLWTFSWKFHSKSENVCIKKGSKNVEFPSLMLWNVCISFLLLLGCSSKNFTQKAKMFVYKRLKKCGISFCTALKRFGCPFLYFEEALIKFQPK